MSREQMLRVVLDAEDARVPTRANRGDAGFDLYVSGRHVIGSGEFLDIPCGIRMALPAGHWGEITGRSSTLRSRGLLVIEGVIDNGYVGPLFTGVFNLSSTPAIVESGERLAQMIMHRIYDVPTIEIDAFELPNTDRGTDGFGSSGA